MKCSTEGTRRKLLILGAGGLGSEFAWIAEEMNLWAQRHSRGAAQWEILGYADQDPAQKGHIVLGYPVHGTLQEAFARFSGSSISFAVAIGNNQARRRVAEEAERLGWTAETLIHPSAIVASTSELGAGSYLAPGTVICPRSRIGRYAIVNTHVSVGHDSVLADFVQICPGARVSGGCRIADEGFIGSNAVLAPRAVVGEGATVGANSLVLRRVAPGVTVLGTPALVVGRR